MITNEIERLSMHAVVETVIGEHRPYVAIWQAADGDTINVCGSVKREQLPSLFRQLADQFEAKSPPKTQAVGSA